MSIFTQYGIDIFTDAMGAAKLIGGVTGANVRVESTKRVIATSGEVYGCFLSLVEQSAGVDFSTLALATALDVCGVSGLAITSTTNYGVNVYAQAVQDGGTRKTGANHRKYAIRKGLLFPKSITVNHQGDASISYTLIATYDGTNEPVVLTKNVSLPAGIADDERFTIGPLTIGGKLLDGNTDWTIDFGINAKTVGADSDIWDTFSWVQTISPSLTIRGIKPEWFDSAQIPLTGLACTHANTKLYLRKRLGDSDFVGDGVAEHIKMTVAGMATVEDVISQSDGGETETGLHIATNFDGTNAPVAVNTASAIT